MKKLTLTFIIYIYIVPWLITTDITNSEGVTAFHSGNLSHLEIYSFEGKEFLILAQVNNLIQLHQDFTKADIVPIGPQNDSQICFPFADCTCDSNDQCTENKILPRSNFINSLALQGNTLFICMTYLSGSCAKITLNGLKPVIDFQKVRKQREASSTLLMCRDPNTPTYIALAPFNSNDPSYSDSIYIASGICNSAYRKNEYYAPVISIVNTETKYYSSGMFNAYLTRFPPSKHFAAHFDSVIYHSMFTYTDNSNPKSNFSYVYYVLSAKKTQMSDRYLLKIGRICANDQYMNSYVETSVFCKDNLTKMDDVGSMTFTSRKAEFTYPGLWLAQALNISVTEPVLFLTSTYGPPSLTNLKAGICAIPISRINKNLNRIARKCWNGIGQFGPSYFKTEENCFTHPEKPEDNDEPFCMIKGVDGRDMRFFGIVGSNLDAIEVTPIIELDPSHNNVTALAVSAVAKNFTVVYLGTSAGRLLRYNVLNTTDKYLFMNSSASSSTSPVLEIRSANRIYSLTSSEVNAHLLANCEEDFSSCGSCLESHNPFCAWSDREGRCLKRSTLDKPSDLIEDANKCLRVKKVTNDKIHVDDLLDGTSEGRVVDVVILADNVKDGGTSYYCHFLRNGEPLVSARLGEVKMYVDANGVACQINTRDLRQALGSDVSFSIKLIVSNSYQYYSRFFVSVSVLVYTCRPHGTCGSCLSSRLECTWCLMENRCIPDEKDQKQKTCSSDQLASSFVQGGNDTSCPAVKAVQPLVSPSGYDAVFQFKIDNFKTFMNQFDCRFSCNNSTIILPAAYLNQIISCKSIKLEYKAETAVELCSVSVTWTANSTDSTVTRDLDIQDRRLELYKCHLLADRCDSCTLSLGAKYNCQWCQAKVDEPRGSCYHTCDTKSASIVKRDEMCVYPRITSFTPDKLTRYGGLTLSIFGYNLGRKFDDLDIFLSDPTSKESIVSWINCNVDPRYYQPGTKVVCSTPVDRGFESSNYIITVKLKGSGIYQAMTTQSPPIFVYTPLMLSLSAIRVQQTGKPVINISGDYLDAGSSIEVTFRSEVYMYSNAQVMSRSNNSIIVQLGNFTNPGEYYLSFTIQNLKKTQSNIPSLMLTVTENAKTSFIPDDSRTITYMRKTAFPAGGLVLPMTGTGLLSVQLAQLVFMNINTSVRHSTVCEVKSDSQVICETPNINLPRAKRSVSSSTGESVRANYSVYVMLDSIKHSYPEIISLVPDPQVFAFPGGVKEIFMPSVSESNMLTKLDIYGRNLKIAVQPTDIRVTLNGIPCVIDGTIDEINAANETFKCMPKFPEVIENSYIVIVEIGKLKFELGSIKFKSSFNFTLLYVVLSVVFLLIIGIVAFGILCRYVHKSRSSLATDIRIEQSMNMMEVKVSKELRRGFAEQMTVQPIRIVDPQHLPMRSFSEFVSLLCFFDFKILNDPILNEESSTSSVNDEEELALQQLQELFHCEPFVLNLIHIVENSLNENVQERMRFSSYLSAILSQDLAFFTLIVRSEIIRLIERYVKQGENLKIVFRRSDSVVERLITSWLAFQLYDHINDYVGSHLFSLYRTLKFVINEGPVDWITHQSKYTLSEEKLLREPGLQFKELKLQFVDTYDVFHLDINKKVQVSVLDVDSIPQVKEKILEVIYSTKQGLPSRYSQQKHAEEFELEQKVQYSNCNGEVNGNSTRCLYLPDFDSNSDNNVFRVNTLKNFHINDDDTICLKPKELGTNSTDFGFISRGQHSFSEISSGGFQNTSSHSLLPTKAPSTISMSTNYTNIRPAVAKQRYYHLVKPYNLHDQKPKAKNKKNTKQRHNSYVMNNDHQMLAEIYYPYLIRIKTKVQDIVQDLFGVIFPTGSDTEIPISIKYLFDLLDAESLRHNLDDSHSHTWKSNLLFLRFWTNIIHSIQYTLDVEDSQPVTACLRVLTQVFMESCSYTKPSADKDSTSAKLLYSNETPAFQQRILNYYKIIRGTVRLREEEMLNDFKRVSDKHTVFNYRRVVRTLYTEFIDKHKTKLLLDLRQQLLEEEAQKLENVGRCLSGSTTGSIFPNSASTLPISSRSRHPIVAMPPARSQRSLANSSYTTNSLV